jgi:hypothetical protein
VSGARISETLRQQVAERTGQRCEYCLTHAYHSPAATFEVDHITARASGGKTTLDNLAYSCPYCNGRKWTAGEAIDPKTGKNVPLFNPRIDEWGARPLDGRRWSVCNSTVLPCSEPEAIGSQTVNIQ